MIDGCRPAITPPRVIIPLFLMFNLCDSSNGAATGHTGGRVHV